MPAPFSDQSLFAVVFRETSCGTCSRSATTGNSTVATCLNPGKPLFVLELSTITEPRLQSQHRNVLSTRFRFLQSLLASTIDSPRKPLPRNTLTILLLKDASMRFRRVLDRAVSQSVKLVVTQLIAGGTSCFSYRVLWPVQIGAITSFCERATRHHVIHQIFATFSLIIVLCLFADPPQDEPTDVRCQLRSIGAKRISNRW